VAENIEIKREKEKKHFMAKICQLTVCDTYNAFLECVTLYVPMTHTFLVESIRAIHNALRKIVHEDYCRGISSTFCLASVDDDSTIIGYFTLSNNTQFAPGSGKLDGIVFDDTTPHTAEIFFFAVDRRCNRATLGQGNGFGRYLMRYALEKLLEIYPETTVVLLESTLAGNSFYPNIGYSYVEDYDFYYNVKVRGD
jgi:ribosomal protein S18 acetylase RimI-like enzyme